MEQGDASGFTPDTGVGQRDSESKDSGAEAKKNGLIRRFRDKVFPQRPRAREIAKYTKVIRQIVSKYT